MQLVVHVFLRGMCYEGHVLWSNRTQRKGAKLSLLSMTSMILKTIVTKSVSQSVSL